MMIILLVIAVVVVSAPLLAVGVVSFGVFREESRHSIIGGAPGAIEHGVRRVLAFHSEASCEPFSQADAWRRIALEIQPVAPQRDEAGAAHSRTRCLTLRS
jgi:hypothetical protein